MCCMLFSSDRTWRREQLGCNVSSLSVVSRDSPWQLCHRRMNYCCKRGESIKGEPSLKSHLFFFPYITPILTKPKARQDAPPLRRGRAAVPPQRLVGGPASRQCRGANDAMDKRLDTLIFESGDDHRPATHGAGFFLRAGRRASRISALRFRAVAGGGTVAQSVARRSSSGPIGVGLVNNDTTTLRTRRPSR